MEGQAVHFSLEVEDAGWENRAFGKVVNAQIPIILSSKAFNECTHREKLHDRLINELASKDQSISPSIIDELQPNAEGMNLQLCNAAGHIVSKLQLQKWRETLAGGDLEGFHESHPFEVLLRHKDMLSKERVAKLDVQVNLRTATENETAGQAGVDTAIFSVSEFIDNSITALMDVAGDRPRVVDVYVGREKLTVRSDIGTTGRLPEGSGETLSYIAIVDSGTGMKDFTPIARRGQVPKRMSEQLAVAHKTEEGMLKEELKRPFLTDDDLSAFGEGCTKVMSDLGSYMYIASRPVGAQNVKETLIDKQQWKDKFSATLQSTSRSALRPNEDKHGPEFMPMAEWTRTPLHQVPGTTATSILPRILSYVERVGCSEAKDGAEGDHSFTAFILLDLHKDGAENVIFQSFHRVCNTLKGIYYHFLGHSHNFMKTFNGHKDGMDSQRVAGTSSSKRTHGEMEGRSDGEKMSRSSMQLHVFFYDGVKRRNAWDLLPGEVIVGTEGQSEFLKCNVKSISNVGDRKEVEDAAKKLEWQGVCGPLLKLMSYGQDKIPLLRHRCLNSQPWADWPHMPATLVDYDMACEDEVSRSIRAVLKTPMQLAAQIPSHSIFNELYSFTFACTHQTWGSGHLPIVGLLQYVPLNLSSQSIPELLGFVTGKRPKWEGKSKRVTREHLRGVTRYPVLPGPQNRLCVWWNGRYSAFSKVDVPAATKPLLPFFSLNEGTLLLTKKFFPKLYQVLCNRDAGEKFKPKSDDNRRALRDANSTLATFSRNCIIGHMSFSDWKTYSSSQAHAPSVHPTKRRKTRGVDEVVTSRFQASDTLDSRSAQKSKTKQTIAPEIFRELQDILKYHRIYRGSQMRYTKPFLCVRMLELSGSKEDASDLLNEVRPQSGKYGALDEKDWICLDASVWLATCILELDPQMELGDQVDKHPWVKEHDLRVFKSCTHKIRSGPKKYMEGDLIKVSHTFKLADVAHGNLVAQKKEFWGVIHAFTEPAKKWGLQRVKASDRRVILQRILIDGDKCMPAIGEPYLSLDMVHMRPEHLFQKSVILAGASKASDEYRRYCREVQAHKPHSLRLCFWPKSDASASDVPRMNQYRSSKLDDIMVCILAVGSKGAPKPHLSHFPGPVNTKGKAIVPITSDLTGLFPLAPYEVSMGLQQLVEGKWEAMLVGETREPFIAPTSTTESHPCPGIFHPQPPPAARVFRIHGLDQRLSPGKYRLLVRVHHQFLTGSREQATRGHGHNTMRALQVQHVEVASEVIGPMNGEMNRKPRICFKTIPQRDGFAEYSAIVPITVLVGEPETITCRGLAVQGGNHVNRQYDDLEVYLDEDQHSVCLELKVLDKSGNQLEDRKHACEYISETYAASYELQVGWSQRVVDKHHGNPPPVPFKLICKLRGRIENLEDEETTLQGNRTATPTDEVLKCSDSHGVVLDPVMVTPNKLALKDERALQEIKEAWSPQDGFQRQPVELSVQLISAVDSNRGCPNVSVAVRPGFARKVSIPKPLPAVSNGQPLPTSVCLQLMDSCGFPASLARSSVVELSRSVMQSIASETKGGRGAAVPLRLPIISVVADIPTLQPPHHTHIQGAHAVEQRRVHLGAIPKEKLESAFSISVRDSMFSLSEPLPLQRLELTATEWNCVRAQGGVQAFLVVSILTQRMSPGGGGGKGSLDWVELPNSECKFPFLIRPSTVPTVEVRCGGEHVPLADEHSEGGDATSKRWQRVTALPGKAVSDMQILLQGEDGRPVDLASGGWTFTIFPPPSEVQDKAREQHRHHVAERNRIHIDQTLAGSPPDVAIDPNLPVDVPEFPPVVVTPDPLRLGVVTVTGVHAPFLVENGPWEYRLEINNKDGTSAAMAGGGKGIIVVVAVPGPPVQWGLSVHSAIPTHKDDPVAISGESSLCLDTWLQDYAGNHTMAPIPEGSCPLVFTQGVQVPQVDGEDVDESKVLKVQLYVAAGNTPAATDVTRFHSAVTFDVMALGMLSWWDGSKLTSKDLILRCRDMETAVGCEKDADGLAVREWFIAQTGEGASMTFIESDQVHLYVRAGRPAVLTATPAGGSILTESYFGCVPIPRLLMSLADIVDNPTPARKNVDFTVRLRQKGTEFRSAKLSKMVYSKSRDAYQDLGASQLQVLTQKLVLERVVPPSQQEPFEVVFEASRPQESATAMHLPFTAETQPITVRPMQHDPKQGITMDVRDPPASHEPVDGVPHVCFTKMRYNGIQTWGCTARSAGAAVATVCVQPSVSQEGTGAMSGEMLRSFFTNTTVQVIDNRVAPDGSVAPAYTTLASPAFVGALTRYQPRVTDLSKARIVNVEALYSPPPDSPLAICSRVAKEFKSKATSRAKVQLRVLPGPLDTVDVTPSSAAAAATEPEGFHTFVRGAKRAGTHVLLQAKDACGNFLTRDAVDGLEGAGSLKDFKSFTAYLVPEEAVPGRAARVPLRCTRENSIRHDVSNDQLLLVVSVPDLGGQPAAPEDIAADPLAFRGPCQLFVGFTTSSAPSAPGDVAVGRVTWIGLDVKEQQLRAMAEQERQKWHQQMRQLMADKEEIGRALMKADRAMNTLARELYSKVRFLLEQVPTLRSVQRFLLKDVSINHGSIWSLEEALLQGQDRPTHSLHLKLCLEREIQGEEQSTVLNCGYSRHHRGAGGGTFSSAHEAAQSALQLIAGLNRKALEHDRGQPGDLLCIFGFAAQCVAFDRGVAAQFLQQSRKHGGLAPDSLEALVKRLRNLLTHRRAQRMGEVLVYGKSAQKQLFDMVSRSKTSLELSIQPVMNLTRMGPNAANRPAQGQHQLGRGGPGPQQDTRDDNRVTVAQHGRPQTLLLPAYRLLRPSMHFMQTAHRWGLLHEMWRLFDAIRYHITGDLVFVDGSFNDGNAISASMSEARVGRGRSNEILCVRDGVYLSATGGTRAGGRNRWPMDDEATTREKLRDVCVPGLKPAFDADVDVAAFMALRRLLDFPFVNESCLITRGMLEQNNYHARLVSAQEQEDSATPPPRLPAALAAVQKRLGSLEALQDAQAAVAALPPAAAETLDTVSRFSQALTEAAARAAPPPQQRGSPPPEAAATGPIFPQVGMTTRAGGPLHGRAGRGGDATGRAVHAYGRGSYAPRGGRARRGR